MDLRGMLNDNGASALAPAQAATAAAAAVSALEKPLPPLHQLPSHPQPPSTPVQPGPQQSFRDYSQTQPSPGRHISHDYGAQHQQQQPPAGVYASPPPYGAAAGPYPNRPAPPPLQHIPSNDLRSPSIGSGPGPSPYRQTPTSSISAASSGYGFPPPQPTPTSPVQRHQYPAAGGGYHRDSYTQSSQSHSQGGMTGPPGAAGAGSYMQGPLPQTPPVGTPGGAHSYLHQRSQSTQSTPTPTSAQSQQPQQQQQMQYGASYGGHGSPVAPTQHLPQLQMQMEPSQYQHQHQQHQQHGPQQIIHGQSPQIQGQSSQPATPVAGPLSGPPSRQSQTLNFGQPPSPYQHRIPAPAPAAVHHLAAPSPSSSLASQHSQQHQAQQQLHLQQLHHASPPPPPPPSLQRHPSSLQSQPQTYYDARNQDPHRPSQSLTDRDRSVSVSPKTRVPSLPSSAGRPSTAISDSDPRHNQFTRTATMPSSVEPDRDRDRAATPAKRKLDDRELKLEELERREVRPPPFEEPANRRAQPAEAPSSTLSHSSKRAKQPRKYSTPPIWAQAVQHKHQHLEHPNSIIYRPVKHGTPQVNGNQTSQSSRHQSPEERRVLPAAPSAAHPTHNPPPPPPQALLVPNANGPLGPWEGSITGETPHAGISKAVADFLFDYVISHPDRGEIEGRNVQFEIEAKLGKLLDKSSNRRVQLPVDSECVLRDEGNWLQFKSSMTEAQHKAFNDFLNEQFILTNKNSAGRVPIHYKHRREIDRFIEIPANVRDTMLPVSVSNLMASRNRSARVRVTQDQKTKEVLAKIIKARVADINLHFPKLPLDCRISVNLEMEWEGSLEDLENIGKATSRGGPPPDRNKDRLSYKHGHYQVDLTQVTQKVPGPGNTQRFDKEHELEIEVNPEAVLDQGRRVLAHQPHQYPELVDGLVNNIRILARKAVEFS